MANDPPFISAEARAVLDAAVRYVLWRRGEIKDVSPLGVVLMATDAYIESIRDDCAEDCIADYHAPMCRMWEP